MNKWFSHVTPLVFCIFFWQEPIFLSLKGVKHLFPLETSVSCALAPEFQRVCEVFILKLMLHPFHPFAFLSLVRFHTREGTSYEFKVMLQSVWRGEAAPFSCTYPWCSIGTKKPYIPSSRILAKVLHIAYQTFLHIAYQTYWKELIENTGGRDYVKSSDSGNVEQTN